VDRLRVEVVHRMPGRVRLRPVDVSADEASFIALAEQLGTLPGISEVRASPRTRSILLLFCGELGPFLEAISASGWLVLQPLRPHTPMRRLARAIDELDTRLAGETRGTVSLGGAALLAFVGAGLWQVRQGHFLPAGMTLFKYALDAMSREAEREERLS